jgi:hypothetical protein
LPFLISQAPLQECYPQLFPPLFRVFIIFTINGPRNLRCLCGFIVVPMAMRRLVVGLWPARRMLFQVWRLLPRLLRRLAVLSIAPSRRRVVEMRIQLTTAGPQAASREKKHARHIVRGPLTSNADMGKAANA